MPEAEMVGGDSLLLAAAEAETASMAVGDVDGRLAAGNAEIQNYEPDVDLAQAGSRGTKSTISAFAAAASEIQASWDARPVAAESSSTEVTSQSGDAETAQSEEVPVTETAVDTGSSEKADAETVNYRTERFGTAVNDTLDAADVHTPVGVTGKAIDTAAYFSGKDWEMTINAEHLAGSAALAPEVANSAYHEARHAEQKHLLMRQKAGERASSPFGNLVAESSYISSLSKQCHIKEDAVSHAFERPISTEHPLTPTLTVLWESMYGSSREANATAEEMSKAAKRFMELTGTMDEGVDSGLIRGIMEMSTNLSNRVNATMARWFDGDQAGMEAFTHYEEVKKELADLQVLIEEANLSYEEAYEQYMSRAYEVDAHAAGDAVQESMETDG